MGTKKVLSFGGFYDVQSQTAPATSYKYYGGDAFLDLPVGPGVVTAQADLVRWNNETSVTPIPTNTAFMAQAGYLIAPIMLTPFLQKEQASGDRADAAWAGALIP